MIKFVQPGRATKVFSQAQLFEAVIEYLGRILLSKVDKSQIEIYGDPCDIDTFLNLLREMKKIKEAKKVEPIHKQLRAAKKEQLALEETKQ